MNGKMDLTLTFDDAWLILAALDQQALRMRSTNAPEVADQVDGAYRLIRRAMDEAEASCDCITWWIDPDTGTESDQGGAYRARRFGTGDRPCPTHSR